MESTQKFIILLFNTNAIHSLFECILEIKKKSLQFLFRKEYYVKGIVYNPTPLGISKVKNNRTGGAGLCSPKITPWGDYISACYDSDFFDGSDSPGRVPAGPNHWFEALWKRDFPHIKALGANTLRIYNLNPTTRKASRELLSKRWNSVRYPYGKDHILFMDMAHKYGFKVIVPLVGDESQLQLDDDQLLTQKIKNIIDEIGDHPALLMFVMGNELGLATPEKAGLRERINSKMEFSRQYMKKRHNRIVPITHCVVDLPSNYNFLSKNLKVDVFCANSGYRGTSLTNFWSGDKSQAFDGWTNLSNQTGLPVLVGELGMVTGNSADKESNWFNKIYKDLLMHNNVGSIGGIFFEYNDEIYKQSGPEQTNLGVVSFVPSKSGSKDSRNTEDFFVPDKVVRKPLFDSVAEGVLDGESINYNTDVFKYWNREPIRLSVQDYNKALGSVAAIEEKPAPNAQSNETSKLQGTNNDYVGENALSSENASSFENYKPSWTYLMILFSLQLILILVLN